MKNAGIALNILKVHRVNVNVMYILNVERSFAQSFSVNECE